MKIKALIIYSLIFLLLSACSDHKQKIKSVAIADDKGESTIDSLLNLELNHEARKEAYAALKNTSPSNVIKLSFLYSRIGKSYEYSFHFDSAVYYTKKAYDLSLKANDKNLQAEKGANLLSTYNKSSIFIEEQDEMFHILLGINTDSLSVQTHVLVLLALTEYYEKKNKVEMSLYLPSSALDLYKKYLKNHTATRNDSLNIALCHIYLSNAYTIQGILSPQKKDTFSYKYNYKSNDRIYNLEMAYNWMGKSKKLLALYFQKAVYASYIDMDLSAKLSVLYRDSLINIAKTTGFNFNDLIVRSNIDLCDIYFYFKEDNASNREACWKFLNDANKYDSALINPSISPLLKWLTGDLLIREKKYDSALAILKTINSPNTPLLNPQQFANCLFSIAACFEGNNDKDSAIVYYKKYALLSDSLLQGEVIKTELEANEKYQNKIKQNKIEAQNIIIQYAHKQKLWLITGIIIAVGFIILLIVLYNKLDKRRITLLSLNQQLEKANQTKAKLFAIISHDFRSPVNQVYQLLKLLQSKNIVIDLAEKALLEKQTQTATSNLLENMEELLIWSKTQMKFFNTSNEKVNIYKICSQTVDLLQPLVDAKQLKLIVQVSTTCIINTDPNFLLTIIRNLLQNAIKASPQKGEIILRSAVDEYRRPYLTIMNQGVTFSQQEYIQAISNVPTLLKGGLGLLIVDELSKKINLDIVFGREGKFTSCNIIFKST